MALHFKRAVFDPDAVRKRWTEQKGEKLSPEQLQARKYEERDDIVLAVNAALVTRRPLLVYGPPGSGKSSLAAFVAEVLGWRYYEYVITSRTQAQDLMWSFDAIRRLSDAQARSKASLHAPPAYIEPGVLWWAFDPKSARKRGARTKENSTMPATDIARWGKAENSVILLDELDKADPFVPNDLLVPLDRGWFDVSDLNFRVTCPAGRQVLLIITTNGERELAPAFLRRCVQLRLKAPGQEQLQRIAELHHGPDKDGLHAQVAKSLLMLQQIAISKRAREPSTAEFLDAIRACRQLDIRPEESDAWKQLSASILEKHSTFADG